MTNAHRFARRLFIVALLALSPFALTPKAEHRAHLSGDLLGHLQRGAAARARVIVHGSRAQVEAIAARHGVRVLRRLSDGAVLAANAEEIGRLAADESIDHLSGDLRVSTAMTISRRSTAADQVQAGQKGSLLGLGGLPGVNGRGVVVAVVDSGIAPHAALARKVIANVSFVTGDPSTADTFGHGTHVAGIIAGAAVNQSPTDLYAGGIASGASLVNVRVLGDDGLGYTSDVIEGIEWVIANRNTFNIRVINLSLGHPVVEPCATDPLCEAVGRAAAAGITVVAAAGNDGLAPNGQMVLGSIMSPGNSPFAITVGSLNTWSTVYRGDDTLATYSSRGPARYDVAVKPDVAAPGNKIVSLEASGAYLPAHYGYLHRFGYGDNAYMMLSGTSMATPMVSGGVALLLQGSPGLTPSQVKLALQAGATYMPDAGLMGAGAGSVNFLASRQIAQNGLSALPTTLVGGLTGRVSGAAFWDAGTLSDRLYAGVGTRLLSLLEAPLIWLNPSLLRFGDLNLVGLVNPLALVPPNRLLYGEVATWTHEQQILWGTQIVDPRGQQILWGTSADEEQILWGTSTGANDPMTAQNPQ